MDVKSINGVVEENMVEVKNNNVEKSEELESKYVDKQQSHSTADLEEQVDNSDLALATTAVKKMAENLPTMDETTIAVQTKKHHEESKITTLMDLTKS